MTHVHARLLAERELVSPTLHARGEGLCRDVASWLREAGIKLHSVTARVKDHASLARKLARPDRSYVELWDITDLLGLRVITYFEDDVDRVGRVLEARLSIDLTRSIDKRKHAEPGRFGYRSLHYVFGLRCDGVPESARAEIQIRTLLEHTWAEIEHDLGYKAPGAVPADVRRRLSRVASMLELADLEFVAIRDELAAYTNQLPRRIADGDEVALDELALIAIVRSNEVASLDYAIGARLGHALSDDVFFPDYLLKMLQLAGLGTVGELRAALARHASKLTTLALPYFDFAWSAWRLRPSGDNKFFRGYALFFLAHACVLDGTDLALDKVERLARMYRELDHPDDPAAAQRIASELVEVFRTSGVTAIVDDPHERAAFEHG
ncbi:MAG: hypothetical protein SFX73_04325 [Kofleriaceae bacterium]|nr:hypothetical protein [Kofleriaceae bacterium]